LIIVDDTVDGVAADVDGADVEAVLLVVKDTPAVANALAKKSSSSIAAFNVVVVAGTAAMLPLAVGAVVVVADPLLMIDSLDKGAATTGGVDAETIDGVVGTGVADSNGLSCSIHRSLLFVVDDDVAATFTSLPSVVVDVDTFVLLSSSIPYSNDNDTEIAVISNNGDNAVRL
jgi:hypothetical protein